jgi:hypothetical protein
MVISFFFLLQNQRTGGQNRSCLGAGVVSTSGRGEDVGKVCRMVNVVQILYTHVCIGKNEHIIMSSFLLKLFQEWGKGR